MPNKFLAAYLAAVKRANEKLNDPPPLAERVLVFLHLDYLALGIPIPHYIPAQKIADMLSSPGHEVTKLMVIEVLEILVIKEALDEDSAVRVHEK
ncbi:MAG: hypothetical protein KME49_27440 [Brasilonema octagenarum HA4186-MV1]|jgi:hypothetical protein|nr:hypothetical protein [Brasilonema octagenarum HA4186-MV1]